MSECVGVKYALAKSCQSLVTWEGFSITEEGCLAKHERLKEQVPITLLFQRYMVGGELMLVISLPRRFSGKAWRGICWEFFR